jgi:hypothetical protein
MIGSALLNAIAFVITSIVSANVDPSALLFADKDKQDNQLQIRGKSQTSEDSSEGCKIIPYEGNALPSDVTEDLRGGAECRFKINPRLPVYNFNLIGNPSSNTIDRILITAENKAIGTLVVEKYDTESPFRGSDYFDVADINFDGYKDIRLLQWWGATGNINYIWWIFNPLNNKFVKRDDLSDLTNPTLHPVTETITTSGAGGMAGKIYSQSTYKFDQKGRLLLIRNEFQDWDNSRKCFIRTVKERKNGKMVVKSREIVK